VKKSFAVTSFTGVSWGVSSWSAPKRFNVDSNDDVVSDASLSDRKLDATTASQATSEKSSVITAPNFASTAADASADRGSVASPSQSLLTNPSVAATA